MKTTGFVLRIILCLGLVGCKPIPVPPVPTATVVAAQMATSTTAPFTPTPSPTPDPLVNCALAPGMPDCGNPRLPLTGRLAYYDPVQSRITALNLSGGVLWQSTEFYQGGMRWSLDGERLFVTQETGSVWLPEGILADQDDVLRAVDGSEAHLMVNNQGHQFLAVLLPGETAARFISLTPRNEGSFFSLHGWVPGLPLLVLLERATAGAGMESGQVTVVDARTETMRSLGVWASLDGLSAWNPVQPGLLAFVNQRTGEGHRLALLNVTTGDLTYPLPAGISASTMAWHPDGNWLVFSAELDGQTHPNAQSPVPAPGIYQVDSSTGAVYARTQPPENVREGWIHWSAGGQVLVYARAVRTSLHKTMFEVHYQPWDGQKDYVFISNLPGLDWTENGPLKWDERLAFWNAEGLE